MYLSTPMYGKRKMVCLSIYRSKGLVKSGSLINFSHAFIYLSIYLSMYLLIYLSINLSIYLSIYKSIYQSTYLSRSCLHCDNYMLVRVSGHWFTDPPRHQRDGWSSCTGSTGAVQRADSSRSTDQVVQ